MGQALYRKYRSRSLSEIVGQDHITQTLKQALKQGRISHAYLFTGPRGVGKTSIARILAHEINNIEYGDDSASLDIIEIDAASNRRIDEIRELRDKVYIAPTHAKYKVYIIDEVHMLTREAFNALLKTLEEPPEHAVFILATTDAHKLPETIVSRTQRFTFKPVSKEKVAAHLKEIAKKEKISITPEALELLADHGEGSFRDSISMLDQVSSHADKLDEAAIRQLLGIPPEQAIHDLLAAVAHAQSSTVVQTVEGLYDKGFQAPSVAKQLGQVIRQQLIEDKLSISRKTALTLLNSLLTVPVSHNPERALEIALLEALPATQTPLVQQKPTNVQPEPSVAEPIQIEEAEEQVVEEPAEPKVEAPEEPDDTPGTEKEGDAAQASQLSSTDWDKIVQLVKKRHNTLYGVIRMAEPEFSDDGQLTLVFAFAFHQKRFNESTNQKAIAAIVQEVTGNPISVRCTLDTSKQPKVQDERPPQVPEPAPQPEQVTAISNIFGGGELIES